MQTLTKQIVPVKVWTKDRTGWPAGPWMDEPDKAQWPFDEHIACMVKRNHSGAWCGYAGVTRGHPLYQVHYDEADVDVHGGLTYSDMCDGEEETGICHVAKGVDGKEVEAWWLGFDCAHYGDMVPYLDVDEKTRTGLMDFSTGVYRDYQYVRSETERLAKRLAGMIA